MPSTAFRKTAALALVASLLPVPGVPLAVAGDDPRRFGPAAAFAPPVEFAFPGLFSGRSQYEFGYMPSLTIPSLNPPAAQTAGGAPPAFDPTNPFNIPGYAEYVDGVIGGFEAMGDQVPALNISSAPEPPAQVPPPGKPAVSHRAAQYDAAVKAELRRQAAKFGVPNPQAVEPIANGDGTFSVPLPDGRQLTGEWSFADDTEDPDDGSGVIFYFGRRKAGPPQAAQAAPDPPGAFSEKELTQVDAAQKAQQAAADARRQALVQQAVEKGKRLEGVRKVNETPVQSTTVGTLVLVRDVYGRQLMTFISQLGDLAALSRDEKDEYIKRLAGAETKLIYLRQIESGATAEQLLSQVPMLEREGNLDEAKWLRDLAQLPPDQRYAAGRQQFFDLYDEFPLLVTPLGIDPSGFKARDLPKLRTRFEEIVRQTIDGAHEEINRVNGFTNVAEFAELADPQYARVQQATAGLLGVRGDQLLSELPALSAVGAANREVTQAKLAVVVGGIAVVAIVAAPVAGLAGAALGAGETTVAAVTAGAGVFGSVAGLGAAGGQLVYDGYQYYDASLKVERAKKGVAAIGYGTVQALEGEQADRALSLAIDIPVLLLAANQLRVSARDAVTTAQRAGAQRAGGTASRAGTVAGVDAPLGTLPSVQRAAERARALGIREKEVDTLLRIASAADGPANREAAKKLLQIAKLDEIVEGARAASVDVGPLLARAKAAGTVDAYLDLTTDLFRATADKKGLTFIVELPYEGNVAGELINPDLVGKTVQTQDVAGVNFRAFFKGVAPSRWFRGNLPTLFGIKGKLERLVAGELVKFSREEIQILQNVLRRPDAAKLYGFFPSDKSFIRIFDDELRCRSSPSP